MFKSSLRRGGFTLVELLVVVAIIALLVSILLPTLGRAKEQTRIVVCLSNLKSMGLGFAFYTTENNDWYPPAAGRGGYPPTWDLNMLDYYENKGMLHCPSDNMVRNYINTNPEYLYPRSYAINRHLTGQGPSEWGDANGYPSWWGPRWPGYYIKRTTDVTDPCETILLGEQWESWYYFSAPIPGMFNMYRGCMIDWPSYEWRLRGATTDVHRDNDAANYLFCDGHALLIPESNTSLVNLDGLYNRAYYWSRVK